MGRWIDHVPFMLTYFANWNTTAALNPVSASEASMCKKEQGCSKLALASRSAPERWKLKYPHRIHQRMYVEIG